MRQLSALDAQFLNVENDTTVGHVGSLVLLAPTRGVASGLTLDELRRTVEPRLAAVPQLRQRVVAVPLGIARPYWVDDPHFDLEFHVREVALPAPGDDAVLTEQVSRIHARPLDRSRPLWEMYLVTGLAAPRGARRQAIYVKVHHAAIDGVTGAEVLTALMDVSPDSPPPPAPDEPWNPAPVPEPAEMLARGIASLAREPVEVARALPRTVPHLADLPLFARVPAIGLVSAVGSALLGVARDAVLPPEQEDDSGPAVLLTPATPLNAAITAHRRIACGSVDLADIVQVKRAFAMTVNDVVLAICAGALRRWLLDHDGLPDSPIVAAVPVSTRVTEATDDDTANQISLMLVGLATQVRDPAERLAAVQAAVADAKSQFDAVPATILRDVAASIPTALAGLALRAAFQLVGRGAFPFNLVISNVPGPQLPVYIGGHRVEHVFPLSAVTDLTGALSITVFSYDGHVDIGLVACRELVPDVAVVLTYLEQSLAELVALADGQADR